MYGVCLMLRAHVMFSIPSSITAVSKTKVWQAISTIQFHFSARFRGAWISWIFSTPRVEKGGTNLEGSQNHTHQASAWPCCFSYLQDCKHPTTLDWPEIKFCSAKPIVSFSEELRSLMTKSASRPETRKLSLYIQSKHLFFGLKSSIPKKGKHGKHGKHERNSVFNVKSCYKTL